MSDWKDVSTMPRNGMWFLGKIRDEEDPPFAILKWSGPYLVDDNANRWPPALIESWGELPEPPKKKHLCLQGCVAVHNCNGYLAMDVYEDSDRKGSFTPHLIKCCPFCGGTADD